MGPFASCCLFDFSAPDYAYLNHYRIAQGSICNAIFFAHQFFSIFQNAFTPNDFVLACSIKKVGGSWNHTYRQLCKPFHQYSCPAHVVKVQDSNLCG